MAGRFGRAIRAEVALGVAILLVVAILTQLVPAREALAQARGPRLAQTARVDDLRVTLARSSLQPGENSFDVLLADKDGHPVSDARRVALRFALPDLDLGESEALAEPRGAGRYTVTGPYLSVNGDWHVRVLVGRVGAEDVATTFTLPVGTAVEAAPTMAAPRPPALGLGLGAGLALVAAAALLTVLIVGRVLGGADAWRRPSGGARVIVLLLLLVVVGGLTSGAVLARRGAATGDEGAALVTARVLTAKAVGPATVEVTLRSPDGRPIEGATVEVEGTMTHAGMAPVIVPAVERGGGRYETSDFTFTMGGDWVLLVRATLPDGGRVERAVEVPGIRGHRLPRPGIVGGVGR